ncbi:ABC transporter permease [Acuticoccus sp. I52.16.1]|nr:FtsX-like permease family protein [Acuticoccus sp. I52.16.1]UOM36948.1 ABC transporter permease [Acuticoccus sp. I52.16.1]
MRGGLRGFYVFLACIALGTATIAAVNSLSHGLVQGITAEGQSLLGGDVSFSLMHRQARPEEAAFFAENGRLSTVATLRAMARPASGRQMLVELKAVDGAYPLYGDLRLDDGRTAAEAFAAAPPGRVPILVDATLLTTADVAVGEDVEIGRATARIVGVIEREPDRLSGGLAFGPRVIMPLAGLETTGLVTTGSLVRWHYRIRGEDAPFSDKTLDRLVESARADFPLAGWRVETRLDAAPRLRESIERFAQFLTIVGLTSLAVGGVGVANSVRAYLGRKRMQIATFRALGATRRFVTTLYLLQIAILAAIGIAIGVLLGAAAPPIAAIFLAGILPVSALNTVFPGALALAALFGALTALTFALLPLARADRIRPIVLLRGDADHAVGTPAGFAVAALGSGVLLAALVILTAYDRWLALYYVVGAIAVFGMFRGVSVVIMAIAARVPRSRRTTVRMAIANMHRRGALTPTVTLSLGLSLTLLVALSQIDGNLRQTLTSTLPDQAPSFFFVDIQSGQRDAFLAELDAIAPEATVRAQPMLRGRIVSIDGVSSEDWPETEAAWVLKGDRGITYAAQLPEGSELVDGRWWDADTTRKEVSFAANLAEELGVGVGDTLRVNVLGREMDAEITNLRTVDWDSLTINFVMIFSPNVFAGAPHAHLATLALPGGGDETTELDILRRITDAFPTVTSIRVKDALAAVNGIVADLVLAVRVAASITLFSSILVLAGTLAASHRSRIYDAVILKTLGARRRTLLLAYGLEYVLLGAAAAVFSVVAGSLAGWFIVADLMEIDFVFMPGAALAAVLLAIVVTVGLGLLGTWRALGERPATVLRTL